MLASLCRHKLWVSASLCRHELCFFLLWVSASLCRHEHCTGSGGVPLPPRTLVQHRTTTSWPIQRLLRPQNWTPARTKKEKTKTKTKKKKEEEDRGRRVPRRKKKNKIGTARYVGMEHLHATTWGGGAEFPVSIWVLFIAIIIVVVFSWSFYSYDIFVIITQHNTTRRECWSWQRWWRSNGGAN